MHYKLGIYGEPATGKSVFALHFPKPFFITTDPNYEFLYEFGAKEEDHKQVYSWAEFKQLIKTFDFSPYETIIVDVIEDLYMWAENEYCTKNRIEDLSDVGYGKGYKIVRSDFAVEIFKLIAKNANVILLAHSVESQGKTARGGDFTSYAPSNIIPEKLWTMINGRLRYFFRAHLEDVNDGDRIVTKRMLSISPKPHEFQINRGLNVDNLPQDIKLDFNEFRDTLGLNFEGNVTPTKPTPKVETPNIVTPKVTEAPKPKASVKTTPKAIETPKVETPKMVEASKVTVETIELKTPIKDDKVEVKENPKEETKIVESQKVETSKVESAAEKLARIRAMIAKQNNK